MHTFFGKVVKYVLWILLTLILLYLLIGLSKSDWKLSTYISSLNQKTRQTTWQDVSWSPATWGAIFWTQEATVSSGIDLLSGDQIWSWLIDPSLDVLSGEAVISGTLDTGGGFVVPESDIASWSPAPVDESKAALLKVIRQRELQK